MWNGLPVKIFPKSEYELRIKRAREFMRRDGLEAIIATNPINFHYLSTGWRIGFDPVRYMIDEIAAAARPGMVIVPLDADPVAVVPKLFSASKDRGWIEDVRIWHGLPFRVDCLRKELENIGLTQGKIGMELGEELRLDISHEDFESLKRDMPRVQFVPSGTFWELRMIKSKAEADKIRKACSITGRGLETLFGRMKAGMTVKEVIRILFNSYMDEGALRPCFPPNLGSNLDARIVKGKEYCFDTGAVYDEYVSDVCRVAIVGKATRDQKDMYEKCLKLNDAVRNASRAGARTRDLWDIYRATIEELRLSPEAHHRGYPDRIGHGFGLVGNEPPSLGPNDPYTLQAGYVHCVEPGAMTATEYFYIEEDVWVTETGNDLLSKTVSRELREIT